MTLEKSMKGLKSKFYNTANQDGTWEEMKGVIQIREDMLTVSDVTWWDT